MRTRGRFNWFVRLAPVLALALTAAPTEAVVSQEVVMDAAQIAHAVDRLAVTGRVLFVAAHPDDENTRLLAYLANARHLTVAYLSMTRGGGGQNLIGSEQAELLDVIRTQELLAARRLDGASQRFTRMRDFGYSKSAEETLAVWGRDEALADVVWVIRSFRPDVIITRFEEVPPNHGHHTASAILAREAFVAAADPARYPEQLDKGVEPWKADRLLRNVSSWLDEPPPDGSIPLDVGVYDARFGLSYGELAAHSRTKHKSQGFGRAGERGEIIEQFVSVAGTRPSGDLFEGLALGWQRFGEDGAAVTTAIELAKSQLNRDHPEEAIPALVGVKRALDSLPNVPRVRDARNELQKVIAAAAGLFVRATGQRPGAVPGSEVAVSVEVIQQIAAADFTLSGVTFPDGFAVEVDARLPLNKAEHIERTIRIPADAEISAPYWLTGAETEESARGFHAVASTELIGRAESPAPLSVSVALSVVDEPIRTEVPVVYTWTDRVHGERERDVLIVPPATVTPARAAVMLPNGKPAPVTFVVRAGSDGLRGDVVLPVPDGWIVEPKRHGVDLAQAGDQTTVNFLVTAPDDAKPVQLSPAIEVAGKPWSWRENVIDYPHIPVQVVLQPSKVRLVPIDLDLPSGTIGYIEGSGDTVAADLAHVGANVEFLDDATLRSGDLARFAAIVVGIRAYNTRDALASVHDRLMDYVESGGTVVVQYNTTSRWAPLERALGPYPMTIGRDRVTDENASMTAIDPQHPLLTSPNRIVDADFDGWVQERGLYFAESWDDRYEAVFRAADPGEEPLLGSTLVAKYGKGRYVYTGLSFFRQLPAGVPGAYRLFANLISR